MIIIKTLNGTTFVNEEEIKSIRHDKYTATVQIVYKNTGFNRVHDITQVERVTFTKKADTFIQEDNSLVEALSQDIEYFRQWKFYAYKLLDDMEEYREKLENHIISLESIQNNNQLRLSLSLIYKDVCTAQEKRPKGIDLELRAYWPNESFEVIKESMKENGQKSVKQFQQLNMLACRVNGLEGKIKTLNNIIDRLMARSLWQRIRNKQVSELRSEQYESK